MAWTYLLIAAPFEVTFATSMKYAQGFTRLRPSVVTVFAVTGGIAFLTLALRDLPVSVGYTMWTGIGATGTVIPGALLFGGHMTIGRALSVLAIVRGVVGLRISTASP